VLLTLAAFVFVLGVLIFVHESGHFLVAKLSGIQVLRFSLGFGKPLVSFRWGETEYVIATLPFGGYVKMAGLEEEGVQGELEGGASTVPIDPARAFDKQSLPPRIAVILAGVTMNFLFAWFLYTVLAGTVGSARLDTTQIDTVHAGNLPASAAALATLRRGDRIVAVNGDTVHSWEAVQEGVGLGRNPITITVAGRAEPIVLGPLRTAEDRVKVVEALEPAFPAVLKSVQAGGPADSAGLRAGDHVFRVGADTIADWHQLRRMIRRSPRRSMELGVRRGDSVLAIRVTPGATPDTEAGSRTGDSAGIIGILERDPVTREHFPPGAAIAQGWRQAVHALSQVGATLRMLVTREASVRDLGGPIAIGKVSGDAARSGWASLFEWMALLSCNLAVLNLLPIPILDGGQLMFLIAEGIRRRPLSLELRLRLTQVGLVLIVALMLFVVGNDLLRYVIH
jgi:regulator of sigma E protease